MQDEQRLGNDSIEGFSAPLRNGHLIGRAEGCTRAARVTYDLAELSGVLCPTYITCCEPPLSTKTYHSNDECVPASSHPEILGTGEEGVCWFNFQSTENHRTISTVEGERTEPSKMNLRSNAAWEDPTLGQTTIEYRAPGSPTQGGGTFEHLLLIQTIKS